MGQFNVQMPDGSTRSVQGTTQSAANNNAGGTTPGSGGGGSSSSAPAQSAPSQSAPSVNSGPSGSYNTKNGTQTVATMAAQLKAAGWGGNSGDAAAVAAAYQ